MSELHSFSTERYILKSMYNRPKTIVEISQKLKPKDFYFYPYRILFTAIKRLSMEGDVTPDGIMTLLESENREGYNAIKGIGGSDAIESELGDFSFPENPSVQEHISIMQSLSYRRSVVEASELIKNMAETNINPTKDEQFENMEDLDNSIKESINSLSLSIVDNQLNQHASDGLEELLDMIIEKDESVMGISISHEYPKLNAMLKRLQPAKLIAMIADAKTGKSTLMLDVAWIVSKMGIPVLFGDSELSREEWQIRLLSKITGMSQDKIRTGGFVGKKSEEKEVKDALKKIKDSPLYWINTNYMSESVLESTVKMYQMRHGIELFVWDYIKTEVQDGRVDKDLDAKINMAKEKIAKDCNIPVFTALQMNPNTKRATDSYGIYRIADLIFNWYKLGPDEKYKGTHKAKMVMCRYGNYEDEIYFHVNGAKQEITEW